MRKEDIKIFKDLVVRLTCHFGNSQPIFYTGRILKIGTKCLLLEDKFGRKVMISYDSIKKIEEVKDEC